MWKNRISLLRGRFVSNVLSLYGVQLAKYLLPLATIPYLTRVLGPSGWGLVALTQAYGAYLSLPVGYGFNYSGTREVSLFRGDKDKLSDILAGINGAKCLLAVGCIVISAGVEHWVPAFRDRPLLLWMGVFAALADSFAPTWYFVGLERLTFVAALDVCSRSIATAGIFLVIRSRSDAWKVLAIWGIGSSVAVIIGLCVAYGEVVLRLPSPIQIFEVLREGRSMFVSRAAGTAYVAGNAFILGLFAPPAIVGYYGGAEKMVRAALQLFQPLSVGLFPKLSALVRQAPDAAARLARTCALFYGTAGVTGGALIFVTAPWLVTVVLGGGFGHAVPILRILALLAPLVAFSTVAGLLWMVPCGLDRPFESISLGAGVVDVGLGLLLAPRYMGAGMAWAVALAELFVTASMFSYLHFKKQGFWRGGAPLAAGNNRV